MSIQRRLRALEEYGRARAALVAAERTPSATSTPRDILEAHRRSEQYRAQHALNSLDDVVRNLRLMRPDALSSVEQGMAANAVRRALEAALNVRALLTMLDDPLPTSAAPGPACDTLGP